MVTAAAFVVVCVFGLFGTLSSLDLKQAGVGLAVALLLDATIICGVLLPASMKLLGERNCYLPRWLQRLSRARLDSGAAEPTVPTALATSAAEQMSSRSLREVLRGRCIALDVRSRSLAAVG